MNKSKKRMTNRTKRINRKYKNMKGGWNNKRYYDQFGRPPINEDLAVRIGKFLIESELKRYLSNDDTYYGNNQAFKHVEDEVTRKLKIQIIKVKFKNDDDYKWLGNQFYYITGNQNPFHVVPGIAGYATWDDGVDFFDWITNTPSRNHAGLPIPPEYKNPLNIPLESLIRNKSSNDTSIIPTGTVKDRIYYFSKQNKEVNN